jgi:hypothetical protein
MKLIIQLILVAGFVIRVQAQPYLIGHLQQTFIDPSRSNRAIACEIYYSANTAGNNR